MFYGCDGLAIDESVQIQFVGQVGPCNRNTAIFMSALALDIILFSIFSATILRIWPTDFYPIFAKPPKPWSLEFVVPEFLIFVC